MDKECKNRKFCYKTISKLKKLIKGDDEDLLYFKESNVLLNPQELKTISKIQK